MITADEARNLVKQWQRKANLYQMEGKFKDAVEQINIRIQEAARLGNLFTIYDGFLYKDKQVQKHIKDTLEPLGYYVNIGSWSLFLWRGIVIGWENENDSRT